jgi:hypothetical protein
MREVRAAAHGLIEEVRAQPDNTPGMGAWLNGQASHSGGLQAAGALISPSTEVVSSIPGWCAVFK